MIEVLLWTVACLLVLMVTVLWVPIDLTARIDVRERIRGSLQVGWLFGAVTVRHDLRGRKPASDDAAKTRKRKKREGRKPSVAVIRRGVGLVGDLLRRIRIRHATLDLAIGGDDPAATGELAGLAAPFVALANTLPGTQVTFRPDFRGAALEARGEGAVRLVPIKLVPPIIRFALSPEVRAWRRKRD